MLGKWIRLELPDEWWSLEIEAVYMDDEKREAQLSSVPTAFRLEIHNLNSHRRWIVFCLSFCAIFHIVDIRRDQKWEASTIPCHRQRGGEKRGERRNCISLSISLFHRPPIARHFITKPASSMSAIKNWSRSRLPWTKISTVKTCGLGLSTSFCWIIHWSMDFGYLTSM